MTRRAATARERQAREKRCEDDLLNAGEMCGLMLSRSIVGGGGDKLVGDVLEARRVFAKRLAAYRRAILAGAGQ